MRAALTSSPVRSKIKQILGAYQLYLLALPAIIYIILFHYGPRYGVQIRVQGLPQQPGNQSAARR